ncbi:fatty acid desaturase [Sporormia fimetaria CBS 119925]|uniref:Fatty acid desaturase n=1 Tax=Sporormia fimetaria CBS 119925 TaxID=1340428 RepID=A0A6A6VAR9_9PLEO|nr:fatty acid desaturase [Sporormia fimetaria CBS 119925]
MVNLCLQPDAALTPQDRMVLDVLQNDYNRYERESALRAPDAAEDIHDLQKQIIEALRAVNDPQSADFEPSVFFTLDIATIKSPFLRKWVLDPYIRWAQSIVRVDTDVVMVSHLLLYLTTTIPSAAYLFYDFRWWHGILHCVWQVVNMGTYTLMMHQHIHMRGILKKKLAWIDLYFPYVTDPLMGHTWNSYYFHHVKHHHVEGNGPDDLSSTVRYQRDELSSFLQYLGRFYFLIWFDLPRYFLRKGKQDLALKAGGSEICNYIFLYLLFTKVKAPATTCVYLVPLMIMRLALMVGNWGQHAFVDESQPDSDFRSSITLIDTASNRYCYNDGYHTSHHLNPLRHWREHPVAFLSQKEKYADEQALVFYNIDYLMITFSVLTKNYTHLAKCLVPMGAQMSMSLEERAEMLRSKTRRFSEKEIAEKWGKQYAKLK